jgi:hypothetical protein
MFEPLLDYALQPTLLETTISIQDIDTYIENLWNRFACLCNAEDTNATSYTPIPAFNTSAPDLWLELLATFPKSWCKAALAKFPNDYRRTKEYLVAHKSALVAEEPNFIEESRQTSDENRFFSSTSKPRSLESQSKENRQSLISRIHHLQAKDLISSLQVSN